MLQRAIACFRAQSYQNKRLVILDSRDNPAHVTWEPETGLPIVIHSGPMMGLREDLSIGKLRNVVNLAADRMRADIIVHWDSDDWSHPERIAEQVAFLQASGKEAVGYREMLFWREPIKEITTKPAPAQYSSIFGEAWLFTSGHPKYCLGTSLCYWRSVWERRPFEDVQIGEDYRWLQSVDSLGVTTLGGAIETSKKGFQTLQGPWQQPRMIASIHGGNTSPVYKREYLEGSEVQRGEWKRVPAWDDFCRRTMEANEHRTA